MSQGQTGIVSIGHTGKTVKERGKHAMRDFFKERVLPTLVGVVLLVGVYALYNVFNPPPGRKTPKATIQTYLQGFENTNFTDICESYIPSIGKPLGDYFSLSTSVQDSASVLMRNPQIAEAISMIEALLPAGQRKSKLNILDYQETIINNQANAEVKLGINDTFSGFYLLFQFEKNEEDWLITRVYAVE